MQPNLCHATSPKTRNTPSSHINNRYRQQNIHIQQKQNKRVLSFESSPIDFSKVFQIKNANYENKSKQFGSLIDRINLQNKNKQQLNEQYSSKRLLNDRIKLPRSPQQIRNKYKKMSARFSKFNEHQPTLSNKQNRNISQTYHVKKSEISTDKLPKISEQVQNQAYIQTYTNYNDQSQKSKSLFLHHLNAVHHYISLARQKKSEIQDLLRSQQTKAEKQYQNFTSQQLGKSLRVLKKVVRLMEIVCKLILGTQNKDQPFNMQKNKYSESITSIYQHMTLSSVHSQSFNAYQLQLKNKDKQIVRLNKLVEMLSVPQKQQKNEEFMIQENVLQSDIIFKNISLDNQKQFIKSENFCQTQSILSKKSLIYDPKIEQQFNEQQNLEICHAYSLWNLNQFSQKAKQQEKTTQTNKTIKLCKEVNTQNPQICQNYHIFMRRYKSITKLCLYSLNLVVGLTVTHKTTTANISEIAKQIQKFANNFNEIYKIQKKYNDQFCNQTKNKLQRIYEQLRKQTGL